tara:strand:- start:3868 stop:4227 length:360 start_codon:yes stop_codon:yes gene_type:complete
LKQIATILSEKDTFMLKVDAHRLFSKEDATDKREQLLNIVLDSIKHVAETESGYLLKFGTDQEDMVLISDWLLTEKICNPFLRFTLHVESNNGPISVELSGPAGTKDFLESTLSLKRWL